MAAGTAPTADDLAQFHALGYFVLRGAFSPQRVAGLTAAVSRWADRVAAAEDAAAGTVDEGVWIDREKRLPQRVGNMLTPDKYEPEYADWLEEDVLPGLRACISGGRVRHSIFGMLAGGAGMAYRQHWHKDSHNIGVVPGSSEELAVAQKVHGHTVQFNAPLIAGDSFLWVVPGSHLRASTAEELAVCAANRAAVTPPAVMTGGGITDVPDEQAPMPGGMAVRLEPGDVSSARSCSCPSVCAEIAAGHPRGPACCPPRFFCTFLKRR
jgi:hypothetical protein